MVQATKNKTSHGFDFNMIDVLLDGLKNGGKPVRNLEVAFVLPSTRNASTISLGPNRCFKGQL